MSFQIIISSAVVSAIVTVIGSIINAHISRKTAAETAKQEMEKLERTWDREDIVSSDDEFAEMAAAVSKFATYENGAWYQEAIDAVASVRAKENGKLGEIMDNLYVSVKSEFYDDADRFLSEAIAEKRRIKQNRQSTIQ